MTEAPLLRRLGSLAYEALIVVALVFLASFPIAPLISPRSPDSVYLAAPDLTGRVFSFLALFAVGAAYFTWCWSAGRRTLPMKTWQLALRDSSGAPLHMKQALARYLAAWIGPLAAVGVYALAAPHGLGALAWPVAMANWLAALPDPRRAFLHDRIAGTQLVLQPRMPRPTPAP